MELTPSHITDDELFKLMADNQGIVDIFIERAVIRITRGEKMHIICAEHPLMVKKGKKPYTAISGADYTVGITEKYQGTIRFKGSPYRIDIVANSLMAVLDLQFSSTLHVNVYCDEGSSISRDKHIFVNPPHGFQGVFLCGNM